MQDDKQDDKKERVIALLREVVEIFEEDPAVIDEVETAIDDTELDDRYCELIHATCRAAVEVFC